VVWVVIEKKRYVPPNDMLSSLSSGITNVTKDWWTEFCIFLRMDRGSGALLQLVQWLTISDCFYALDFQVYWFTGISIMEIKYFLETIRSYITSSEEFNLACAYAQAFLIFKNITVFLFTEPSLDTMSDIGVALSSFCPVLVFVIPHISGWVSKII